MLSDELKSKIRQVDILTDFDETMVHEQGLYKQFWAYFFFLKGVNRFKLFQKTFVAGIDYLRTKSFRNFYSLLLGCPVKIIDKTVSKYTPNLQWQTYVGNLKVGVVSRNNSRIISNYLNLKKNYSKITLVAANKPEIKKGIYTGMVDLVVDDDNLFDFVKEKDYICGNNEKKILEKRGIYSLKIGKRLYLCSKNKLI